MLTESKLGKVLLVGAGPGPVDLMTVRAVRAVESAGALLYDALCSEEAVALAPPGCVRIQTGKRAGKPSMKQDEINRLMLRLARRGLHVVRLKGGDPSIFGRVGEEMAFLERFGVETEVVPGVTAACAAAAQFGFPLTHRGEARRVVFTTARIEEGGIADDWRVGADPEATVAIYMGVEAAPRLAKALMAAGRAPSTPVAAVENAGAQHARLTVTTLVDLRDGLISTTGGPVLIVVGEVAANAVAMKHCNANQRIFA
ncbi:uroporphyrinogen-III C-methyltransferase [Caulobacter segnis]|uniref:uroporphyrinogen-III C-methyltransferase n=2 Tax=Caulobacter segnis TaxID=88688 RepID=D5VGS8_CAUST|nr:uroporphyrinogen-III C-methyltransferase [Caulobacter segnis]ADG10521.1 uroporphyrin-III C-methyltransferase [Caulobacter segnis ATCC 21756]AVQ02242.1 uroporphyrinogen-III C-methyltransferase [Caulobacter segnis]